MKKWKDIHRLHLACTCPCKPWARALLLEAKEKQCELGAAGPRPLLTGILCADALPFPERCRGSTVPGKTKDHRDPTVLGQDFLFIFNILFRCYSHSAWAESGWTLPSMGRCVKQRKLTAFVWCLYGPEMSSCKKQSISATKDLNIT